MVDWLVVLAPAVLMALAIRYAQRWDDRYVERLQTERLSFLQESMVALIPVAVAAVRAMQEFGEAIVKLHETIEGPDMQELMSRWKREMRAEMRATYEMQHPERAEIMRGLGS